MSPLRHLPKLGKRVKWVMEDELESVKYFKLTDLPHTEGLSHGDVVFLQEQLKDVEEEHILEHVEKLDPQMEERKEIQAKERYEEYETLFGRMIAATVYPGLKRVNVESENLDKTKSETEAERTI